MGRRHYLTRLALGRSPYQSLNSATGNEQNADAGPSENSGYIQRYDSSGRPIHPETAARNAEMRQAQNSVLALVGVVRRNETQQLIDEGNASHYRKLRRHLLSTESEFGEWLQLLLQVVVDMMRYWPISCLGRRVILGFPDTPRSFASVLTEWLHNPTQTGLLGIYSTFLPGYVANVSFYMIRNIGGKAIDVLTQSISKALWRRADTPRDQRRLNLALQVTKSFIRGALDTLLLPISYYTFAQSLGIAPAWPLLPSFGTANDSVSYSNLSLLASTPLLVTKSAVLRRFFTPATLMFTWLVVLDVSQQSMPDDGSIFHRLTRGRTYVTAHLERWLGSREMEAVSAEVHEVGFPSPAARDAVTVHRCTTLAGMPLTFMQHSLDEFLDRLITFPLETVLVRAVAVSYLAGPLPITSAAHFVAPQMVTFCEGSLSKLLCSPQASTMKGLGSYASKLGLSIALQLATDIACFAAIYGTVRFCGNRYFGWKYPSIENHDTQPPRGH